MNQSFSICGRGISFRYLSIGFAKGNTDVVAPTSALGMHQYDARHNSLLFQNMVLWWLVSLLPSARAETPHRGSYNRREKERRTHPILETVAIPVQLRVSTPGPKYSMMKPVPPLTVKRPASFIMISFGAAQPLSCPSSLTPKSLGALNSHGAFTRASTA